MIKKIYNKFFGDEQARLQIVRYLTVGFSCFTVEYLIFVGLLYFLDKNHMVLFAENKIIANTTAIFIMFWVAFYFNRNWSFKSKGNPVKQTVYQIILFFVNMYISNVALKFLVDTIGIIPQISKILVMGMIVMWNFVLFKFVIYKH